MSFDRDQTSTMPADSWGNSAKTMDALNAALMGDEKALQDVDIKVTSDSAKAPRKEQSSLEDLLSKNKAEVDEELVPGDTTTPNPNQPPIGTKDIEVLKVDGKEIEWDFSDREKLKAEIQKGLSAQRKLQQAAKIRKENEALKKQITGSETLSPFRKAQALLEKGYTEHAVKSVLGDKQWEQFLQRKIDEEIEYRSADPVQRAELDAKRAEGIRKYQENEQLERIKELEDRIAKREESIVEQQFQSYLESATTKYDLGKWIDDRAIASDLNESLSLAANNEIVQEQQMRERMRDLGKPTEDITARDINKIYHKHALRLLRPYKNLQTKTVNDQVQAQSEQAKRAAQAASQKSYSTSNIIADVIKSGGGMNDILDRLGSLK